MNIDSDPIIVERLASEREEENWNFRTFLKGYDLDIKDLDSMVHQHYETIAKQIDCTSCSNCCYGVSPVLDSDDVARLSKGLEISKKALIKRFLTTDEDGDLIFQNMPQETNTYVVHQCAWDQIAILNYQQPNRLYLQYCWD